jgi:hypothetical protein
VTRLEPTQSGREGESGREAPRARPGLQGGNAAAAAAAQQQKTGRPADLSRPASYKSLLSQQALPSLASTPHATRPSLDCAAADWHEGPTAPARFATPVGCASFGAWLDASWRAVGAVGAGGARACRGISGQTRADQGRPGQTRAHQGNSRPCCMSCPLSACRLAGRT